MELIYLYIKEMNQGAIRDQGLVLSRNYHVAVKNNKLSIVKQKDTLADYYGSNIINITSLVGKNGSGKSSILDALGLGYQDRVNMNEDSFFMIYAYNNDYFIEIYNKTAIKGISNMKLGQDIEDNYVGHYMHMDSGDYILSPLGKDKTGKAISGDFPLRYHYNLLNYKSPRINQTIEYTNLEDRKFILDREYIRQESLAEQYTIISGMKQLDLTNPLSTPNMNHVLLKVYSKGEHDVRVNDLPKETTDSMGFIAYSEFVQKLKSYADTDQLEVVTTINMTNTVDPKLLELLTIYDTANINADEDNYLTNHFDIRIVNLSEGMTNVLDCLSGLATLYIDNSDEAVLLLDEPDRAMHPELARQFISILINQLRAFDGIKLQIVMSTHSPFVISDLLPESVYYVEKNNIRTAENTLAENIHTLLYDKFFMNYTIGELARTNIEAMYTELRSEVKLTKVQVNYYRDLIKRIGNDVLRNSLEKLLATKLPSEVDRLEMEIEALNKLIAEKQSVLGGLKGDQD